MLEAWWDLGAVDGLRAVLLGGGSRGSSLGGSSGNILGETRDAEGDSAELLKKFSVENWERTADRTCSMNLAWSQPPKSMHQIQVTSAWSAFPGTGLI